MVNYEKTRQILSNLQYEILSDESNNGKLEVFNIVLNPNEECIYNFITIQDTLFASYPGIVQGDMTSLNITNYKIEIKDNDTLLYHNQYGVHSNCIAGKIINNTSETKNYTVNITKLDETSNSLDNKICFSRKFESHNHSYTFSYDEDTQHKYYCS